MGWRDFGKCLGFLEKKTTVREFVVLLISALVVYGVSHSCSSFPSANSSPANSSSDNWLGSIFSRFPRPQLSLKVEEALKNIDTILGTIDPSQKTINDQTSIIWNNNLYPNLLILAEQKSYQKAEINAISTALFTQFKSLDDAQKTQTLDDKKKKEILSSIKNSLTELKNTIQKNPLFWTGNAKWIEVVFWSLFGVLVYLIQQTSDYYLREDDSHNPEELTTNLLIRRKPQYYALIFQTPFITLSVLWILSLVNFNVVGISFAFNNIPEEVLIALAFILGLYNKVTTTQLSMIVSALFKDAWQKTIRKIEISPSYEIVEYGNSRQFNVIPDVKVKWSIWSKPAFGTIDTATGMYIAPPGELSLYSPDGQLSQLKNDDIHLVQSAHLTKEHFCYNQVLIRAVREEEELISALALVILKKAEDPDPFYQKFEIDPFRATVEYGNGKQFRLTLDSDVKVKWSILSKPSHGLIDDVTGMYIAPPGDRCFYSKDGQLNDKKDKDVSTNKYQQDIICAVGNEKNPFSALAIVTLKHPGDPDPFETIPDSLKPPVNEVLGETLILPKSKEKLGEIEPESQSQTEP